MLDFKILNNHDNYKKYKYILNAAVAGIDRVAG